MTRDIIGSSDLLEIYVEASFETCAKRDPKDYMPEWQRMASRRSRARIRLLNLLEPAPYAAYRTGDARRKSRIVSSRSFLRVSD